MLFDWLIIGQVAPSNPASAVRGPKYVVKTGKTPVLEGDEWRRLIERSTRRSFRSELRFVCGTSASSPTWPQCIIGTQISDISDKA